MQAYHAECTEQQTATNLTRRDCSCSKLPRPPRLGALACPHALPQALAPLTAPCHQPPLPAQQTPGCRRGPAGGCCHAHCRSHWSRRWSKCLSCPRHLTQCHRHWGGRLQDKARPLLSALYGLPEAQQPLHKTSAVVHLMQLTQKEVSNVDQSAACMAPCTSSSSMCAALTVPGAGCMP